MTSPIAYPCVIFALARESAPFLRAYPPRQRLRSAPCWAHWCGPAESAVLVLQTGIGPRPVERALAWLSGEKREADVAFAPECIVSAGFAGGLRAGVRATDVILADEVIDDRGRRWTSRSPDMLSVLDIIRGRLLTWPHLVGDPAEKRRLALTFDACAVDMESAVIAAFCAEHGIPFLCVRAISDEAQTAVSPRLLELLSGERVSPWRLVCAGLSSPRLVAECWRLARTTRRAAERLAVVLRALLAGGRTNQPAESGARCLGGACRA